MYKEETQTNGAKGKKLDDCAQGFTFKRWDRLYVSRKEGGTGIISIEDCLDASIKGLEDYTKKSKEKLVTAANTALKAQVQIEKQQK